MMLHHDAAKPFTSRADLHVHSRYSDRPSEWVLRRIGSPESFVQPLDVYRQAMAMGMSFVTISDHNKIDGALEIADKPNTFISVEVTTYFPENGAKMHILATGITPEQFKVIQDIREDIYAFRQYVTENDIIYSVAHPLFLVNDRLTIEQFEKLLVMFNRFEVINGTRDPRAARTVAALLASLTPSMIDRLADRHGIAPVGPAPHLKMLTAGSDDHSGLYVASAHTVTPEARTVEEYLAHLRAGRHEPAGKSGSSIHLAHCFYHIAYAYYKDRILGRPGGKSSLLGEMLKRLLEPPAPKPVTATARLKGYVGGWFWRRHKSRLSPVESMLVDEFQHLFRNQQRPDAGAVPVRHTATEAFEISCRIAHQLGYTFGCKLSEKLSAGDLMESIQTLAALGPVAAAISPYLAAFKTQHKDEAFIRRIAQHFDATRNLVARSARKAWITDTFDDVNGVTRTIKTLAAEARAAERPLTVLTCLDQSPEVGFDLKNFQPVGRFAMPEYDQQQVSFPPFLEIIEYIERCQFEQLIISTPGPMGLTALAAAKMMHLGTVGIYHTDFPQYVRCLTDDQALEHLTWRYMVWFFDQCDLILAPSDFYRRQLIDKGFNPTKVKVLRRGVDDSRFHPELRQEDFWESRGGRRALTFAYAGRVSAEKNINTLVAAFEHLLQRDESLQLAIIGDGPMLKELKRRLGRRPQFLFTGFLSGAELASAYASSDAFVFPSTTDTFGNAVLEAQATGLPAIVSDRGGPQEIVAANQSGLIVNLDDAARAPLELAEAMWKLASDPDLRDDLRGRALRTARQHTWSNVLDTLWYARDPGTDDDEATPVQGKGRREMALSR